MNVMKRVILRRMLLIVGSVAAVASGAFIVGCGVKSDSVPTSTSASSTTTTGSSGTCYAASLSVVPTSGPKTNTLTLTVSDQDRGNTGSQSVIIGGTNLSTSRSSTLTETSTAGVFTGTYTLGCTDCSVGDVFTVTYADLDATCHASTVTGSYTISGGDSCTDATVTLNPKTASAGAASVMIAVDDYDKRCTAGLGTCSVTAYVYGPGTSGAGASATVTLTETGVAGHFQGTVNMSTLSGNCSVSGTTVTVSYADVNSSCRATTVTANWNC